MDGWMDALLQTGGGLLGSTALNRMWPKLSDMTLRHVDFAAFLIAWFLGTTVVVSGVWCSLKLTFQTLLTYLNIFLT